MGVQVIKREDGVKLSVSDGFSNWSKHTLFQCIILGTVLGPIIWAIKGDYSTSALIWCVGSMAAAPLIVDFLKPQIRRHV